MVRALSSLVCLCLGLSLIKFVYFRCSGFGAEHFGLQLFVESENSTTAADPSVSSSLLKNETLLYSAAAAGKRQKLGGLEF